MDEFCFAINRFWPIIMVITEEYLKEKLTKELDAVHVVSNLSKYVLSTSLNCRVAENIFVNENAVN